MTAPSRPTTTAARADHGVFQPYTSEISTRHISKDVIESTATAVSAALTSFQGPPFGGTIPGVVGAIAQTRQLIDQEADTRATTWDKVTSGVKAAANASGTLAAASSHFTQSIPTLRSIAASAGAAGAALTSVGSLMSATRRGVSSTWDKADALLDTLTVASAGYMSYQMGRAALDPSGAALTTLGSDPSFIGSSVVLSTSQLLSAGSTYARTLVEARKADNAAADDLNRSGADPAHSLAIKMKSGNSFLDSPTGKRNTYP